MRRALVVLTIALTGLLWIQLAKAATERFDLEARLPVAHPVFCADSQAEWNRDPNGGSSTAAYTWVDPAAPLFRTMWFSPGTCKGLEDPSKPGFSDAAETLYHEWFHAHFLTLDEGETECLALYVYRYELRHKWGLSAKAAQAHFKRAWASHEYLGLLYPSYRGTCTLKTLHDPLP